MSLYPPMQNNHLTWAMVDSEAEALGVDAAARRKWRQRRVPYEWRIKIMESMASRRVIVSAADFDALPVNPGRIAA